ncbi:MAG TPA: PAS domain S-box protein [Gammaproteobacteria bacterium]|nr:PAS domain S-box protein [Gammaproteobacteria bacterium]
MTYFQLHRYSFRHLILGILSTAIFILTLLVAFISSLVAFDEMNSGLYQQGVQLTRNLAEGSIKPLMNDNPSGAEAMLDTLLKMEQITKISIHHTSNTTLVEHQEFEHIYHAFPSVTPQAPFNVLETSDNWYFSALVSSKHTSEHADNKSEQSTGPIGYINLAVSKKGIKDSRQHIFMRNFIMSLIVGLALLLLMYLALRNLTRPLEKLSRLMEQGERGEYHASTHIQGTREIAEMSNTFNNMVHAIRERELNLSLTLDSIIDAVIATDAQGLITRMNPVAESLTGWSLNDALGVSVKDIFPIINITTREKIKNPLAKVLTRGETVYLSNHTTLISKDNTEFQITSSASPIRNKDDVILGMVLVFNNVTEQYQLRQAASKNKRDMQAVMDNSPAVIYVKDIRGRYTFVNRYFEDLFHLNRSDITGKTDHDIFPRDIADKFRQNDLAALAAGRALESEEIAPHDDGPHNYVSMKFPLFDDRANAYAVCGISTDITDLRKKEEQLRQAQKMDALGKLTGGIAHDYNNMLGIVLGYAEILSDALTDQPELEKCAQYICHASKHSIKLTRKLLAFSRHKAADTDTIDLNFMLSSMQDMLNKTLTARIKLIYDLDDDLWPIHLDINDLEDALINLCINAMHAIDKNGQITVRTRKLQLTLTEACALNITPGDYVLLNIIDNGCGMDEKTRQKIFEPFYTTKGDEGTGLGLAQVYGFVERSHASIQVHSEKGQGSQFVLYFPRYHDDSDPEKPGGKSGTKSGEKSNEQSDDKSDDKSENTPDGDATHNNDNDLNGSETILIVDDEPPLNKLIGGLLESRGYTVFSAENGEQALDILKHQRIDLLFSDVIMPEMDGYQLAAIVQEKYPGIEIQLASGFTDNRHSHMVSNELRDNMLDKPFDTTTLLRQLRKILEQKSEAREA